MTREHRRSTGGQQQGPSGEPRDGRRSAESRGIDRRRALKYGAGVTGLGVVGWVLMRDDTGDGAWSMEQVGNRMSDSGQWDHAVTSKHVDVTRTEPVEYQVDGGSQFRVHNHDTETSVTATVAESRGSYAIAGIDLELYENSPANGIREEPWIALYGGEIEQVEVPVKVSGDRDIFARRAVSTFSVEILRDDEVIGEAGPRPLAIGYEFAGDQVGSTLHVTRHESVDPSWIAYLRIDTDGENLTTTIPNEAGAETFEIDADQLGLAPGRYSWDLHLYERDVYQEYGGGDYSRAVASLDSIRTTDQIEVE